MFESSNFLWENLEQTALVFIDFQNQIKIPAYMVSTTGDTISYLSGDCTNPIEITSNDPINYDKNQLWWRSGSTVDGRIGEERIGK